MTIEYWYDFYEETNFHQKLSKTYFFEAHLSAPNVTDSWTSFGQLMPIVTSGKLWKIFVFLQIQIEDNTDQAQIGICSWLNNMSKKQTCLNIVWQINFHLTLASECKWSKNRLLTCGRSTDICNNWLGDCWKFLFSILGDNFNTFKFDKINELMIEVKKGKTCYWIFLTKWCCWSWFTL